MVLPASKSSEKVPKKEQAQLSMGELSYVEEPSLMEVDVKRRPHLRLEHGYDCTDEPGELFDDVACSGDVFGLMMSFGDRFWAINRHKDGTCHRRIRDCHTLDVASSILYYHHLGRCQYSVVVAESKLEGGRSVSVLLVGSFSDLLQREGDGAGEF